MFDYIEAEYPLPEPPPRKPSFQTKCLDCTCARFKIDADGKLWQTHYGMFEDDDKAEEQMERPLLREMHGFVNFYDEIDDVWHEYRAKFTDGRVVEIEKVQ